MGLIDLASGASIWRGYDYYENKKVGSFEKVNESEYSGAVNGSGTDCYQVIINIEHPRKSKCNCPHADGRRVICKHMIALYFTIFPKAAADFIKEVEEYDREEEKRQQEEYKEIERHVNSLSKQELREALISYMADEKERRYR